MKKTGFIFVYAVIVFLLPACSSVVQKGGEILERSAFEERTVTRYRAGDRGNRIELRELQRRNGETLVQITADAWPGFALRGDTPSSGGVFALNEVRFLSSHIHGWNEFNLQVLGSAAFQPAYNAAGQFRITSEVERVQISSGRIRLKSSRITGDAALISLRNRRERILALVEWMQEQEAALAEPPVFYSQRHFEMYWKPKLFPELVRRRNRPPEFSAENDEWERVDGVTWNLTYTRQIFPEELHEYRNSAALLRDWEETLPWIYMEHSWDKIINSLNETNLQRTR